MGSLTAGSGPRLNKHRLCDPVAELHAAGAGQKVKSTPVARFISHLLP